VAVLPLAPLSTSKVIRTQPASVVNGTAVKHVAVLTVVPFSVQLNVMLPVKIEVQ
jgi:hypothetical protein